MSGAAKGENEFEFASRSAGLLRDFQQRFSRVGETIDVGVQTSFGIDTWVGEFGDSVVNGHVELWLVARGPEKSVEAIDSLVGVADDGFEFRELRIQASVNLTCELVKLDHEFAEFLFASTPIA